MGIGETITVINKSGKVVSSSKHIVNVFKEAKSAYRERKAEIQAERNAALASERKLREGVKSVRLDDDVRSRASSRHSKATHRSKSHRPSRPPLERGFTDSFYANDDSASRSNRHRFELDLAADAQDAHKKELIRRNTETFVRAPHDRASRARSDSHIDMDLAYGELPPPLPSKNYDDGELREKASKLTMLLDEANCLQHTVTTTIENLQKNPDALAAVALTLAEISAILGKMGPGVLLSLKGTFPAVVALLASPQFMIAAGVGVGVTIVALGGFKIVKRLQGHPDEPEYRAMEVPLEHTAAAPAVQPPHEESFTGLDELEPPELGRIELWRRGIADVEADSLGSTVDGEFITPGATKHLVAEGILDEDDIKSRRSHRSRREKDEKSRYAKSTASGHTSASKKTSKTSKTSSKAPKSSKSVSSSVREKKEKEPSLLKTLFRSHTMAY